MKKLIILALFAVVLVGFILFTNKKEGVKEIKSESTQATQTVQTVQTAQTQVVADKTIEVQGLNFSYDQKEIKVKKGEKIAVKFVNTEGFHDFVIDELNVRTQRIGEGKSETILIPTDKTGTYAYYCSVGQHRKMGMEGKLTIEE